MVDVKSVSGGLSQSEVMVGALLAGFVLWLLLTKRLAAYWSLLTGGGAGAPPGQGGIGSDTVAAPPVTSTTSPNAGTSSANALSFIPGSVTQFGTAWVWRDATTGAQQVGSSPPPGYTPPATTGPTPPTQGGTTP